MCVSTSYDEQACQLSEQLTESVELTGIDGNVMNLEYTTETSGEIGSGHYSKAKRSQIDAVYHAHWFGENTTCVALKIFKDKSEYDYEFNFLESLHLKIADSEENHIIKLLGQVQHGQRKARSNEEIHTKIIKGAARALAQLHKYGGHNDIKHENFVVSRDQDPNADVFDVKLIDFNVAISYGHGGVDVERIKREDVKDFAVPEVNESNYTYNTKLDRVIKACFQDESIRPDIQEIVEFLNDEIDEFAYKQNAMGHHPEFHQEPTHYGQHGAGTSYPHHMRDEHVDRDDSPPRRRKFPYCC
uniref:Protein kinase domain-containing protein n=1 Tax=Meloidogyne javanica TaxID=6303 RepID=A0A915LUZ5_MELJA